MYYLIRKDNNKTYIINEEEKNYCAELWDKGGLVKLQGDTFESKQIKAIDKIKEKSDGGEEKRRLYMENLNAKRAIPEYQALEDDQYKLLGKKAEALANGDRELSKDIQSAIVENSDKMREIARQHGLYKPELYV